MEDFVQLCKKRGSIRIAGLTYPEVAKHIEDSGYIFNIPESSFGLRVITLVYDGSDGRFEIYVNVIKLQIILTFIAAKENY